MPYYSDCGSKLESGARFCGNCEKNRQVSGTFVSHRRLAGGVASGIRWLLLLMILLFVPVVVVGCAPGRESKSAEDVAVAFYEAANEGNYQRAKNYLSIHKRVGIETAADLPLMPAVGLEEMMDAATKGGTITQIEVLGGEEMAQALAIVYLMLHFEDGSQERDSLTMGKVDGVWRIDMSTWLMTAFTLAPLR